MTQHRPNRLNLPGDDAFDGRLSPEKTCEVSGSGHDEHIARLYRAFESATGWKLPQRLAPSHLNGIDPDDGWNEPTGSTGAGGASRNTALLPAVPNPPVARSSAELLASELEWMLSELDTAWRTIWHREAELAAGVPVRLRDDEEAHLAARLEALLKGAAEALHCQAAGIYLLDDATTELKLRACWGLPRNKLLDPARPLRGAVADLEALLGHAVAIEETALLPSWRVPESYASAACVPISSPTEPLGTLWVFCDRPRDFTSQQTNLLETIAGRIASELQRDVLLNECAQSRTADVQLVDAADWQRVRRPTFSPLLDGWEIAGFHTRSDIPGGTFHDWWVGSDGSVSLAAGGSIDPTLRGAMSAAELRGLLYGVAGRNQDPSATLDTVNQLLCEATPRAHEASLGLVQLGHGSFAAEFATAGDVVVWHISGGVCQRVSRGAARLGSGRVRGRNAEHVVIRPDDVLILGAFGSPAVEPFALVRDLVGESLPCHGGSLDELTASLREALIASVPGADISMVVVRRTAV